MSQHSIPPAPQKLGVLTVGLGAVSTTFIAGTMLARKGLAKPVGSLTQMGRIRLGRRTEKREPFINEVVPLASLDSLVFGAWDIFTDNAYEAAKRAAVLEDKHLEPIKDELSAVRPMPAVFNSHYVKNLHGEHIKKAANKKILAELLRADIRHFKSENNCDALVVIWCASTEIYIQEAPVHATMESFLNAMEANDEKISPSMLYAYAALMEGVPFLNGAPNLTVDIPAIIALAKEKRVPIAGKDFKTGQTLMKTILAPGFKARKLGLAGWYSTNILGNRDGEVLDDPESFKTKEVSKLGVLDQILEPKNYPDLYGNIHHIVKINYYPPRGDNKEGWDNIDIFGWLGYPMQIKVNFLCRDSILAAPIVLDLVLFADLARRVGMYGIQEWLSFYFKSPMHAPGLTAENDLFIQLEKLENNLRFMAGETLINHLGQVYYGVNEA